MARIDAFFKLMSEEKASDLHLATNNPPMLRINGELVNTWTDAKQRSAFGHVGLQNYDDGKTIRFRNLRAKSLP